MQEITSTEQDSPGAGPLKKGPPESPVPFKIQTLADFNADSTPDGMVCGPEGCVVPERAVDAALEKDRE